MMEKSILQRGVHSRERDGFVLRFLYHTAAGRFCLKGLTNRGLSQACGRFLDSPLSRPLVKPFVRKNRIDLGEYLSEEYRCFNDCFCRRIRPELRPIDMDPGALIAPCDGYLSAYRIQDGMVIPAKHSRYAIGDLLNDAAAQAFDGGLCLVFRLCVNHYHRYCFPDSGRLLKSGFIPGELHTVRPIALEEHPVFVRNCREYAILETENLGTIAQIEVGAMLVGKIANHPDSGSFVRGQEKGCFLYGGSTVILLIGPDRVRISPEVLQLAQREMEIPVRMGERIAEVLQIRREGEEYA